MEYAETVTLQTLIAGGAVIILLILIYFFRRYFAKREKPSTYSSEGKPVIKKPNGKNESASSFPIAHWYEDKGVRYEFTPKLLGNPWIVDPSLKLKLGCSLCIDSKSSLVAYDPNSDISLDEKNTPQALFDGSQWPELEEVYVDESGLWEKVKLLLPYLVVAGLILALIVAIDKLGM